ncbi:MAG: hypothetical protein COX44_00060 [Candidatus Portnoybacteria bacterium CG23_combo_of_CG06-09_8_20_14_all_37_13]|uniref:Uncharacterized protein n=1 Tax=Candidatus Portnoybacteria bacterium CG23_combo_of_CG06-09_8_20_14_all_37_13 TaxID=1974819 RepID=A0A2G9YDW4_9BACT|nr:MAG: hypothetical protein COX44_00060 [Candidatus Portnoybacteria bacterium CG23_combo_of_CG06-09_8_20_14_all_37_13]
MSFCLGLCLIGLFGILLTIDPYQTNILVKLLFFLSLFLTLTSLFSLLGFSLRKKPRVLFKRASIAFWQAVLISGFLVLILILWRFIKNLF